MLAYQYSQQHHSGKSLFPLPGTVYYTSIRSHIKYCIYLIFTMYILVDTTDNSDADMLLIRFCRIVGRTAQEYLTANTLYEVY